MQVFRPGMNFAASQHPAQQIEATAYLCSSTKLFFVSIVHEIINEMLADTSKIQNHMGALLQESESRSVAISASALQG